MHSELIFSACHPRGADLIAAAVRKHALNRVVLASCVCCPLEFQCISCNDQRNRARIHLFDRLGLDRCRFETINIRDHLGAADSSEEMLVERMRDFLREAFIRARYMGPLRQSVTKIGNRILILGRVGSGPELRAEPGYAGIQGSPGSSLRPSRANRICRRISG